MQPSTLLVKGSWLFALCAAAISASTVLAENPVDSTSSRDREAAPVTLSGDTLFFIRAPLGPFSSFQRADAISRRLQSASEPGLDTGRMRLAEENGLSTILLDSLRIASVTDQDAAQEGTGRVDLARERLAILRQAVAREGELYSKRTLINSVAVAVGVLAGALLLFWLMARFFPRGYRKIGSLRGTLIRPLSIRSHEILNADQIASLCVYLLRGTRLLLSLAVLYGIVVSLVALVPWTRSWDVKAALGGVAVSIFVVAAAVALHRGVIALARTVMATAERERGTLFKAIRLRTVEVLSEEQVIEFVKGTVSGIRLLINLLILYFSVTIVFSLFDFTRNWAGTLLGYIVQPLGEVVNSLIGFLPNLFFIIVAAIVARYLLKLIRLIFLEIGRGRIVFAGFYPEWAIPTYKIVRFLVVAFVLVVVYPYLPGSESEAFKGVSVFLGILFSLGSASAIANAIAGIVLTYMRPFKIGDRVKIADTVGDVVERTLLVTRVRTIKNVDTTIPNALVLGSHIINFSSSSHERGLILHTSVSIGYNTHWRKVHRLLIAAAEATPSLLKDPPPFVLQPGLGDFYVTYEINAYTDKPNAMATTISDLHQNVQERFNKAGVEILSPHYAQVRDGNRAALPDEYLPKDYTPSGFRIFPSGGHQRTSKHSRSRRSEP
jgi:small-conductance mechanosensitive channel